MTKSDGRALRPESFPGLETEPVASVSLADAEETRRLGRWLAERVRAGDFLGLVGDLGAGKTTLMQGFVAQLSDAGEAEATSPTYSLVQVYETRPPIFHMDLYRLESLDDLESIGYWDYLESGEGVCCVEWLDRIEEAWPGEGMIIELLAEKGARRARLWASRKVSSRLDSLPSR